MLLIKKLWKALLIAVSIISIALMLISFWVHWPLPNALYTANSHFDILKNEVTWGLIHTLIEALLLFFPAYILAFFYKRSVTLISVKRIVLVLIVTFVIGLLFSASEIAENLKAWEPLEAATRNFTERRFDLGRTQFFPLKQYTVYFTIKTPNFSFIEKDIIPDLENQKFFVDNFWVVVGNQGYISQQYPLSKDIYTQNIKEVPFSETLKNDNHLSISFNKGNSYSNIYLSIDSYNEKGTVKGMLRR